MTSDPTPLLSEICITKAKEWKYQVYLWKHLGYVEHRYTLKGYRRSHARIRTDKVPLKKGQIVAVTTGPIDFRQRQVFYIGVVEKGRVKTSTVRIVHMLDNDECYDKVGRSKCVENYCIALPRSTTFDLIEKKSLPKQSEPLPTS